MLFSLRLWQCQDRVFGTMTTFGVDIPITVRAVQDEEESAAEFHMENRPWAHEAFRQLR